MILIDHQKPGKTDEIFHHTSAERTEVTGL